MKNHVSGTNDKYNVIYINQNTVLNFTNYLMPLCKKIVANKDKTKFTIMADRYFDYSNEGLFCGISDNSTIREQYTMETNDEQLIINDEELLKLYNSPIKLKISKYNEVIELASKYVQKYQWFYTKLIVEENNTTNNRDCESDYED